MKRLACIFPLLFSLISAAESNSREQNVFVLKEVLKPTGLSVGGQFLYVSQGRGFLVYRLPDMVFLRQAGIKGEGPGEFRISPNIRAFSSEVHVTAMGKVMSFKPGGDFLRERKIPFRFNPYLYPLLPLGRGFAGFNLERVAGKPGFRFHAHIYGPDWKDLALIHRGGAPPVPPPPPPGMTPRKVSWPVAGHYLDLDVWEERVYIADTREGFRIRVFDSSGKRVHEIRLNEAPKRMTSDFRRGYLAHRRRSPGWEREKHWLEFRFPEVFPAFFAFRVRDGKIYVVTYKKRETGYEVISLDLAGNILGRTYAFAREPFDRLSEAGTPVRDFDIQDGTLYFLRENGQTENWELVTTRL